MSDGFSLHSCVSVLSGVGPKSVLVLKNKSIHTIQDLLFILPLRYEDKTKLTALKDVVSGKKILIEAEVVSTQIQFGKRRSLLCRICVQGLIIGLRFYYFSKKQRNNLKPGTKVRVYGTVYKGASGFEIYHPEYNIFQQSAPELDKHLTPVYPLINGISQTQWRKMLKQCFTQLNNVSLKSYIEIASVIDVSKATSGLLSHLKILHFPPANMQLDVLQSGQHPSMQALIKEELLAHYLSRKQQRLQYVNLQAPAVPPHVLQTKFIAQLPFTLTAAQQRVCKEIASDLAMDKPMLRLLQGDVGSGKTLVGVYAALQLIGAGFQVVLMVPTEILARQHYNNIQQWLKPLNISVGCLFSSLTVKQRRIQLDRLCTAQTQFLVGTQAVFQEDVNYAKLGLIIIDEQHRFGVDQRLALRAKLQSYDNSEQYCENHSASPHQLIMTATPIPRTLAMTMYADVVVSVIDELPKGRKAIDTILMSQSRRAKLFERIAHACQQGRQIYWVCTLIENSEQMDAQAVDDALSMLKAALPDLNIVALHGRVKAKDKDGIMDDFIKARIDILVATTVIEVGVDVPNASIIVIENAERLGLAQLHQLRGRVGRGVEKSFCVLLHADQLGQSGKARLNIIRQHQDGFVIAEEDLRLRGAGDLYGVRQSGEMLMRIADLQRDAYLLPEIKKAADFIEQQQPQMINEIIMRWLADTQHYAYA